VCMYVCMYVYMCACVDVYVEIDLALFKRIQTRILPIKIQPPTFKCKIHSIEVDLQYLKSLKTKNHVIWILFAYPSSGRKMDGRK